MTPQKPYITRKTKTLEIPWEFKVACVLEVLRKLSANPETLRALTAELLKLK